MYVSILGDRTNCNSQSDTGSHESGSDSDDIYALLKLSEVLDRDLMQTNEVNENDYFWMKIRMFERALGFANQAAKLKFNDQWYGGFDDPSLILVLQDSRVSRGKSSVIDIQCNDGTLIHTSLLHHAAACGMVELVKSLVVHGMSPEVVDDDGETVLHVAMRYGYADMVQFLVEYGVTTSVRSNKSITPLHYLYMFGKPGLMEADGAEALATQVLDFNGPDCLTIAGLLIRAGADVNAATGEFDSTVNVFFSQRISGTPLHAAVTVGNKTAVEALLQSGADVNSRPFSNSFTPLELAAQLHLAEIVAVLLKHGASLKVGPDTNQWASSWAMHHVGFHIVPLTRYVQ